MSKPHDHKECNHTVRFCAVCDECYCIKCEEMWDKQKATPCYLNHYPWYWSKPYWAGPNYGTGVSNTLAAKSHNHAVLS